MKYYLAIDLGTTGCRSIIFDEELKLIADSYKEYGLQTPNEKWAQQDAELWWSLSLETAKQAIEKSQIDSQNICGISVSSQGITIVPVDKNINPLYAAISWLDVRAEEETAQLIREFGAKEMFALTGKQINACYSLPKIMWLKNNEPQIYAKTWKFLMPMDFLIARLTGTVVTDHSMASGTLLFDLHKCCWSDEVLTKCGIPKNLLPELKCSGEIAGTLLPEIADTLGLKEDCIVAVGAQDQRCASLAAGLADGVMTISLGTAGAVCKYQKSPNTTEDMRIGWSAYTNKNSWVTEGVINTAAVCLRWLRDTIYPNKSYIEIDEEAEKTYNCGSSLMFYPYMNGPSSPDNYPLSEGMFYGVNLSTEPGDFALAVLEGVAFQIRIMLEAMNAYGNVHTVVLFGGGSKSPLWCQIISDITGMKIIVPSTSEAAGAGAAILAGIADGKFSRENPPHVPYKTEYVPAKQAEYAKKYEKYRTIEKKIWA